MGRGFFVMSKYYQAYAPIYQQIGQPRWSEHMARWSLAWLQAHSVSPGRVVDWGCGEGTAARVFAAAGWNVLGIDQSHAMLALARRDTVSQTTIRYQQGDLRETVVTPQAMVATAYYDTLNYLASSDDLHAGWQTMAASVMPGGFIIADINTPYEYATTWRGQYVITTDTDDALVLNQLRYNARSGLARGRIMWFAREVGKDIWRRGSEMHLQRAHTDDEMIAAIEQAGLRLFERHTPQGIEPSATSTRLIYVAHKPAQ
jgi:SAM-dependent methyltransferase